MHYSLYVPIYYGDSANEEISISNYGNPLDISFPALSSTDKISLTGAVKRLILDLISRV